MIVCVHVCVHMYQNSAWHAENTIYVFAVIGDNDNKNKNLKVCAKLIRMY